MLPCPERPPPAETGGFSWYGAEFTKYKCPDGKMFANGFYPFMYSNCTVEKVWDPPETMECIRELFFSDTCFSNPYFNSSRYTPFCTNINQFQLDLVKLTHLKHSWVLMLIGQRKVGLVAQKLFIRVRTRKQRTKTCYQVL